MKTLPKHLRGMDPESLRRLQSGFNRFRFGFAEPGEKLISPHNGNTFTFVGNFLRKKDADATGVTVNPYLFGKFARGWSAWTARLAA